MWDAWVGKDREVMDVDSDAGNGAGIGGWGDLLVRVVCPACLPFLLLTDVLCTSTAYISHVPQPAPFALANHYR
ncbi:hypothetical protein FIBSPDRAFT_855252 [Athelia psychrophila]|uniref:Uncharacterized protein n=1 Tax=Athelia psychrophila TaxID=1759441 RepID=A0A166PCV5_9AGAM|nr:hypothetical protein FIBSPDRAFT_855252 [Fibularhizoctonia sp. CBS 109695]